MNKVMYWFFRREEHGVSRGHASVETEKKSIHYFMEAVWKRF